MKFYQCEKCKKVIVSKDEIVLQGWTELIEEAVEGAREKHIPVVEKKCSRVRVSVGSVMHPMSAEHLIEWVALETTDGYQMKYFAADEAPEVTFSLRSGEKVVAVYAYCNLHGLWKA